MANLKDIRSRIGSVKNTQQITRAMKMVSAAKLRKAQENVIQCRPYANSIKDLIFDVHGDEEIDDPRVSGPEQETGKSLYVVLSSDRGLCGGFNNSISKIMYNKHLELQEKNSTPDYIFIGKKVGVFFQNRDIEPKETILNLAKEISFKMADKVAEQILEDFTQGAYDEVVFVYNKFISAIAQEVTMERVFPINKEDEPTLEVSDSKLQTVDGVKFEPSKKVILNSLLDKYFTVQVYKCLSESVAAEHAARMSSMENATNNANDMISKLTLTYNKLRQASITTELIEITSGAEALN